MKKLLSSIFTLMISFAFIFCLITNVNAYDANGHTLKHQDYSFEYYGEVWCTPSYVQNGKRAARAYLRFRNHDTAGNVINDTGRLYTAWGNGPTDTRVLRRSHYYYDTIYNTGKKTEFFYGYNWVPVGDAWPVSLD